jgi:hypothetical protein
MGRVHRVPKTRVSGNRESGEPRREVPLVVEVQPTLAYSLIPAVGGTAAYRRALLRHLWSVHPDRLCSHDNENPAAQPSAALVGEPVACLLEYSSNLQAPRVSCDGRAKRVTAGRWPETSI